MQDLKEKPNDPFGDTPEFGARGVGKVTIGITGLWQFRAQIDTAF